MKVREAIRRVRIIFPGSKIKAVPAPGARLCPRCGEVFDPQAKHPTPERPEVDGHCLPCRREKHRADR